MQSITEESLQDFVTSKRKTLEAQLLYLTKRVLHDFDAASTTLTKRLKTTSPESEIPYADLLNLSIPFSDNFTSTLDKISNLSLPKDFLNAVCAAIKTYSSSALSSSEKIEGSKNFDQICDYNKRSKLGHKNTKNEYNLSTCRYVMSKTFRKSVVDTFQCLFRAEPETIAKILEKSRSPQKTTSQKQQHDTSLPQKSQKNESKLPIACIGGGPGSDCVGLLSFLVGLGWTGGFDCCVYDFQSENWE